MPASPPNSAKKRVLSGMRSTGKLHLGNYVGALANWVKLQDTHDCFFFIADWHALTTDYADTSRVKENTLQVAIDWLSAGLDPEKCALFVQSQVKQHAELHLLFSMITPLGWLERVPTYKEQQQNLTTKDLTTYGFLGYPVLQAADILVYQADFVPVGEDQVSHIELTREIGRRFNTFFPKGGPSSRYGGVFGGEPASMDPNSRIFGDPQPLLTPIAKLPGTDGRKMSKSYNNYILLSDPPKTVDEKLRTMVNDPARARRELSGNPDICPVGDIHKTFSSSTVQVTISSGCRTAGISCIDCKQLAADSINQQLIPIRNKRSELECSPNKVAEALRRGTEKARSSAEETMRMVRKAVNLTDDFETVTVVPEFEEEIFGKPHLRPSPSLWELQDHTKRGDELRKFWLDLNPDIKLRETDHRTFVTPKNKRVFIATGREKSSGSWKFRLRNRHFDVLVFLCWTKDSAGQPSELKDFIVPRKWYEKAWKFIPKESDEVEVEVTWDGKGYLLKIENTIGPFSVNLGEPHEQLALLS